MITSRYISTASRRILEYCLQQGSVGRTPISMQGVWRILSVVLFLAALAAVTLADGPSQRFDQGWRVESFQVDAGLSRASVQNLAFETNGTLWAATSAGVYRFDGYSWSHFGTTEGLPSMNIGSVLVTRQGKLWVGTDKGAGVFDGQTYDTRGSENHLAGPSIRQMMEDPDGTIWFCSHLWPDGVTNAGLTSLKDGNWTVYHKAEGLPHDHVLSYFRSSEGDQYAATSGGLARKEGDRWQPIAINSQFPEIPWCLTGSTSQPVLAAFFSSTVNQVFLRKNGVWSMQPCNPNYSIQTIMTLLATRDDQIWAVLNDGRDIRIHRWTGSEFVPESAPIFDDRRSRGVPAMAEGPDGAIWYCGEGFLGCWRRNGGKWAEYTDLSMPNLDRDGHAVFSGKNGFFRLDHGHFTNVVGNTELLPEDGDGREWSFQADSAVISESQGGRVVRRFDSAQSSIKEASNIMGNGRGSVWIAGKNMDGQNAIAFYDGQLWQTRSSADLQGKSFMPAASQDAAQFTDKEGGFWFLLNRPLTNQNMVEYSCVRFRDGQTQIHTLNLEGYDRKWINFLRVSPDGNVWIYGSSGLFQLDRGSNHWNAIAAVGGRSVRAAISRRDEVWFGTTSFKGGGESGIFQYRKGEWKFFPAEIDAGFERIYRGVDDSLYFYGNQCLYLVAPDPNSSPATLSLKRFSGCQATRLLKDRRGNLWITLSGGNKNRLVSYHPDGISPQTHIIEATAEVRRDARFRAQIRGIERFVALEHQGAFQYSWRIDQRDWNSFGMFPVDGIPVAGLNLGRHVFEVRARDEDLDIDPTPAVFTFMVVTMPLQDRWWFKPVVVCVFSLVLILAVVATERAIKYARANTALGRAHDELCQVNEGLEKRVQERTQQLSVEISERQKSKIHLAAVLAERNRLAGELHDSLEQGLTGISLQLEFVSRQLKKAPETAQKHLDLARTLIRQSQAETRNSVWDLRSHLLESEDLAATFAAIGNRMTKGMPVQIKVNVQGTAQRLPELTDNQLFRIGQEAITNALKHAQCRNITVLLSYQTDSVTLDVSDDGLGFALDAKMAVQDGHFGLIGMHERAHRLGGQFKVESAPGQGTKISVKVPFIGTVRKLGKKP